MSPLIHTNNITVLANGVSGGTFWCRNSDNSFTQILQADVDCSEIYYVVKDTNELNTIIANANIRNSNTNNPEKVTRPLFL